MDLSYSPTEKKMVEFGSWNIHTASNCVSMKNKSSIEIVERMLARHEQLLQEILLKISDLLNVKEAHF
jgi:hypothetical protein